MICCLQEVVRRRSVAALADTLSQFRYVATATFGPQVRGGLVVLSRYPISFKRFERYLVSRHAPPSLGDWLMQKGRLLTRVERPEGAIQVINTHLQSNPTGEWSRPNRWNRRQAAELLQLRSTVFTADERVPLVVAGDFNTPSDFAPFQDFLRATGLVDSMAGDPRPTCRASDDLLNLTAIDHLLVRPPAGLRPMVEATLTFENEQLEIPGGHLVQLSDHFGIAADMKFIDGGDGWPQPPAPVVMTAWQPRGIWTNTWSARRCSRDPFKPELDASERRLICECCHGPDGPGEPADRARSWHPSAGLL